MTKRRLLLLCAIVPLLDIHIHASQLQDELAREWNNKIVIVRSFPIEDRVRFDKDGNPLGHIRRGYWSSEGMVQIRDVSVRGQHLRLSGERVLNIVDSSTGKFKNFDEKRPFEADLELDPAWRDAASVRPLLDKVFLRDPSQLIAIAPDYWSSCLEGSHRKGNVWLCGPEPAATGKAPPAPSILPDTSQLASPSAPSPDTETATATMAVQAPAPPSPDDAGASSSVGASSVGEQPGARVYRVGSRVTPPKALSTPDPVYNEPARQARLQGTVLLWVMINAEGRPERIRISRPLGAGLDDKAVEAVEKWRFAPATLDGKPVPVLIDIQVNFRLR